MMQGSVMLIAVVLAAFVGLDASACEPIHKLIFQEEGEIPCQPGELVCDRDPSGDPVNCVRCNPPNPGGGSGLCWASDCRTFGGSDKGQYGQFKKDGKGELEALVMVVTNHTTGNVVTLVDQIANPDCPIPAADGQTTCSAVYKVRGIKPEGGGTKVPLCTLGTLDDVNTIARTLKSAGVFITDLNGKSCKARKKVGDQWWMYYQTCCDPPSRFGNPGETISTELKMILDNDGVCSENPVRDDNTEPETIPGEQSEPCV